MFYLLYLQGYFFKKRVALLETFDEHRRSTGWTMFEELGALVSCSDFQWVTEAINNIPVISPEWLENVHPVWDGVG